MQVETLIPLERSSRKIKKNYKTMTIDPELPYT